MPQAPKFVWKSFAAAGQDQLTIRKSTMNFTLCQMLISEIVRPPLKLELKQNWTLQHENDPNLSVNTRIRELKTM